MRGGRFARVLEAASDVATAWRSRRDLHRVGAGGSDADDAFGDDWRRRVSDQFDLYRANAGTVGVAYERDTRELPGPIAHFRIDQDGAVWQQAKINDGSGSYATWRWRHPTFGDWFNLKLHVALLRDDFNREAHDYDDGSYNNDN